MGEAVTHEVPDYPVQNLEVAERGLATHRECGRECDARRYFGKLVPELRMIARRRAASGGWNLWSDARGE